MHVVLATADPRTIRKVPEARRVNKVLVTANRATSGRYQTAKQGKPAPRHSSAARHHFDRRIHLAATLSRLIYAGVLCDPWPEPNLRLVETFHG
ncbi:MAG: hypothetical protein EPN49_15515 [Rhodanobacter sp.]|nr:MAG: hypothetical protein EPN49_15515 [Rhodanobacter sp.]